MAYIGSKRLLNITSKGDSAYIRYSAHADGTNFTETWSEGQNYIGVATAQTPPTEKTGYEWILLPKGEKGEKGEIVGLEITKGNVVVLDTTKFFLQLKMPTVDAVKVSVSGLNLWDEKCVFGYISTTTGNVGASDKYLISENYIPVLSNTSYYLHAPSSSFTTLVFYDAEKTFISALGGSSIPYNKAFTTPTNCAYMMFQLSQTYGKEYKGDICFNVNHNDLNGKYEPYVGNTIETIAGNGNTNIETFFPYTVFVSDKGVEMTITALTTIVGGGTTHNTIPIYVKEEAERVANNVLATRDANCFVFGAVSDIHADANDASMTGALRCTEGIAEINNITQLDLVANLGDIVADKLNENGETAFKYVRQCFADVRKTVPVLQMQGNHDNIIDKTIPFEDEMATEKQKYFAYIGANNVGTVVDYANKYRNYGYIDYPNHKIRVVYVNSVDIVGLYRNYKSTSAFSEEQINWLVNNSLDLSDKGDDEQNWGVILFTHHPLNWDVSTERFQALVKAFANKTNGTMPTAYKQDGENGVATSVTYDFTNTQAEFIAHFHGHLHNFRVDKYGDNDEIVSVTIPNACSWRNNYYGADETYVASHPNDPDKFGDVDSNGNQRVFAKTANTAEDTSFDVVVVNRETRKIHCFNYGAGIDREINY